MRKPSCAEDHPHASVRPQSSAQVTSYADDASADIRLWLKDLSSPRACFVVDSLRNAMDASADAAVSVDMSRYMRNLLPFHGIKAIKRRQLQTEALQRVGWQGRHESWDDIACTVLQLWLEPQREMQHAAVDMLVDAKSAVVGGGGFARASRLLRLLLLSKSWWDTVDPLSSKLAGALVLTHPEQGGKLMDEWVGDMEHMWLRRCALLHQLSYKGMTNTDRLLRFCKSQLGGTDFFICKAIGWALRTCLRCKELQKEEAKVREWVQKHFYLMSTVTLREATKCL